MRKRWLVFALASVVAMTATGCKKDVEEVVDSIDAQIDTVADSAYEAASAAIEDESPEISEPTTEASKIVRLDDIREETMDNVMLQSKNGVNQLYFMTGMTDVTAEVVSADIIESRNRLLEALGISEEELKGLSGQEEINRYLVEKGLNENEVYAFSIFSYLLDAYTKGDNYVPTEADGKAATADGYKDYYTKTVNMLSENGIEVEKLLNFSDVEAMSSYVNSVSGLSLYELNCKLWVNSIFPGVNVEADALLDAKTPNDFLEVFTVAGYSVQDLKETTADADRSAELLKTLDRIEKESIAEEEKKENKSGNSGNSNTSKGGQASNIANKVESSATAETLPDKGGENNISFIVNGGDSGYYTGTGKSSSSGSSNTNVVGKSSIKIDDDEYQVKIIVKEIVRNTRAIAYISDSNGNLPGEIHTDDIPDDFEWVVVKFTVKSEDSNLDTVVRPLVRVKTNSGGNPETDTATRVFYIQPQVTNESDSEKTYYVAFWLPDSQKVFTLYFGDASGSVYKFKSSAIEKDDDDDK